MVFVRRNTIIELTFVTYCLKDEHRPTSTTSRAVSVLRRKRKRSVNSNEQVDPLIDPLMPLKTRLTQNNVDENMI